MINKLLNRIHKQASTEPTRRCIMSTKRIQRNTKQAFVPIRDNGLQAAEAQRRADNARRSQARFEGNPEIDRMISTVNHIRANNIGSFASADINATNAEALNEHRSRYRQLKAASIAEGEVVTPPAVAPDTVPPPVAGAPAVATTNEIQQDIPEQDKIARYELAKSFVKKAQYKRAAVDGTAAVPEGAAPPAVAPPVEAPEAPVDVPNPPVADPPASNVLDLAQTKTASQRTLVIIAGGKLSKQAFKNQLTGMYGQAKDWATKDDNNNLKNVGLGAGAGLAAGIGAYALSGLLGGDKKTRLLAALTAGVGVGGYAGYKGNDIRKKLFPESSAEKPVSKGAQGAVEKLKQQGRTGYDKVRAGVKTLPGHTRALADNMETWPDKMPAWGNEKKAHYKILENVIRNAH